SSACKTAGRRPSKRQKCEKSSPIKPELEGGACGSEYVAASGETPKASDGDGCAEDPGGCNVIQQKKSESIPGTNEVKEIKEHNVSLEAHAVISSSAASRMGSGENLHIRSDEEQSCGGMFSDGPSWEDADLPKMPIQLDSGAFLNEDSNQPMPVHRFFGDIAVLQDLPAAALPSTMKSRREFRKLHFIAKQEEEEEED
ncbi:CA174 protein, partial [Rhinopomastus cyanomelas]|nr:CA174 protein [Rhinopomastus cyanomelas]